MRLRRSTGIVRACRDERLFAFPLWPRQAELLRDVERGPRLHVWALGRRSGKTTMAAIAAVWDALLRPKLDALVRPGERRYAVAVATNIRQARVFVAAARSVVERSPLLRDLVETITEDEIAFRNGTAIAAFPCTARGIRGWPISCLLMDEAAHFVSDTEGPAVAERVFTSLVPSTAQFGDLARVIVASTPYGQDGMFADLYQQAATGELADAVAHRYATADVNPTIGADFLERERARDPDGFASEYEAKFVGGGSAFLDPERVAAAVADRGELPPEAASAWVAGIDPAFASDPFGLAIVGWDRLDPARLVLGLAQAWTPSRRKATSFEERREIEDAVLAEVAAVCQHYGVRLVASDQYLAAPVADYLRARGLNVLTLPMTATTKTETFTELRARINTRGLELYDHPDLLGELRRLRTRYAAGSAAVVNPRVGGSHGDLAAALAVAVRAAGARAPSGPHAVTIGHARSLFAGPLGDSGYADAVRSLGETYRLNVQ